MHLNVKLKLCLLYLVNLYLFLQIWCWSCHNGSALLKMSALPKEQDDGILQIQKSFLDGSVLVLHFVLVQFLFSKKQGTVHSSMSVSVYLLVA